MATSGHAVETEPGDDDLKDSEPLTNIQPKGLREFDRLDSLLSQVPKKAQHGILKTSDLVLTCIDANTKYIALGTNVGLTFVYSRKNESMQRLKATNQSSVITSVSLHDGIDDLVAVGTASGDVTIFCIPGLVSVQKKQIQKFDVQDIHRHYITCLAWSTNGMKLYSGDKNGQIAATEIDFYTGVSKSCVLLIEPSTEITQLDYQNKVLLVSTRQRSFVVRLDRNSEITQIGTKERKIPGPFGACFIPELCKPEDVKLYAARPGCRLWLADAQGTVKSTHIFGDPLSASVPEMPLLAAGKLQPQQDGFQFGMLRWLQNGTLVTWSSSALVVLDPLNNRCVARQGRISGVVDAAVVQETQEIFLLRRHADARIIRISDRPEVKETVESRPITLPPTPADSLATEQAAFAAKPEQKEESSALSFFKKLGLPLKWQEDKPASAMEMSPTNPEPVSDELPPVMELASPELERLRVFTESGEPSDPTNAASPLSAHVPKEVLPLDKSKKVEADNSIVFSHRMKKHKKKRHKEEPSMNKEPEADTISTSSSTNAAAADEEESAMKALKEADEMLNSVHNLMVSADKVKAEPLPDVLPTQHDFCMRSSLEPDVVELKNEKERKTDEIEVNGTEGMITLPAQSDSAVDASQKDASQSSVPEVGEVGELKKDKDLLSAEKMPVEVSAHGELNAAAEMPVSRVHHHSSVVEENRSVDKKGSFIKPEVFRTEAASGSITTNAKTDIQEISAKRESETDLQNISTSSSPKGSDFMSEVDQHMTVKSDREIASLPMSPAAKPKDFQNASDTVDSALSRISDTKQHEADDSKEDLQKGNENETGVAGNKKESKQRRPLVYQQSFQDIYNDLESVEIEASKLFKTASLTESYSDDFYSLYMDSAPTSPGSANSSLTRNPLEPAPQKKPAVSEGMEDVKKSAGRVANSWSEFTAPANIYSLAVSDNHVWFTDKSENIYYSALRGGKSIVWRKATGCASQISVSPSGNIVWRLHKGVVYAGTKISTRHPEGLKWVEAVRDVQYISVFNTCAWFIKRSGELMVQHGLSKERPCYRSRQVECSPYRLKQITCGGRGVVWAITDNLQLLVRTGVSDDLPAGEAWEACVREAPPYLFSHVAIDNESIGWAIDVSGQIWFCKAVTQEYPKGTGEWFQVPMSGYVMQDASTLDMIRAAARKFDPSKLSQILSTTRGGLVTGGAQGVWLAMDSRNLLQVCRGTLEGYHWTEAQPAQMSPSSVWKHVCASTSHLNWGYVWAQHINQDLYAFKEAHGEAHCVPDSGDLACVAVAPTAIWALSCDGEVQIRTGMGSHCPLGTGWATLDLSQLGDAHFVHLSCNSFYVWAVELQGGVYQRIGVGPPAETNLNPVWLPIDTFADIIFTKVFVGPLDWMVWAVDNRRLFYVRVGITESMPIGKEWMHIPGIQAMDMALTKTGVWALTVQGEIFFRYGISLDNPAGDYWKKIPGTMSKISATESDDLYGIDPEGRLMQCKLELLLRRQNSSDAFVGEKSTLTRDNSMNDDWEFV